MAWRHFIARQEYSGKDKLFSWLDRCLRKSGRRFCCLHHKEYGVVFASAKLKEYADGRRKYHGLIK